MPQSIQRLLTAALLFACPPALVAVPLLEPDHTIWGSATINGQLAPDGTFVEVFLAGQGGVLDRFVIGSEPNLGDRYALRLPISSEEPRIPGTSRPGDAIEIYLDGALAAETMVGGAGDTQRIDLDPFFDDPPELWIEGDEVTEGDSGSTDATFTVRLSRPVDFDVTVDYATVDGTALSSSDYTATQGTLLLEAGFVQGQIRVPVLGDTDVEPPEQFTVELSNPQAATLRAGAASATATIDADDARWILRIEDTSVLEGDGGETEAVFTVTASFEVPGESGFGGGSTLSAEYATLAGSAEEDLDFVPISGTLSIDTGSTCAQHGLPCTTITVPVITDQEREDDESFSMLLSLPSPNPESIAIADAEGIATILNDEHLLVFQEAQLDPLDQSDCGASCLNGASSIAIYAEDGLAGQVYVASELSSSLVVFDRSATDGTLTATQILEDLNETNQTGMEGLGGAAAVLADPTGSWVWSAAADDDRLLVFARDAAGQLSLFQTVGPSCDDDGGNTVTAFSGPRGLLQTHDRAGLYVLGTASNSVALYRDTGDGTLACEQAVFDAQHLPSGSVDGLRGATDAVVSPTGDFLYVASALDAAVVIFALDPATGRIVDYLGRVKDGDGLDGIDGASSLAIVDSSQESGTGSTFLYVAGAFDNSVVWFEQDPTTGLLTYAGRRREGLSGVQGLVGPASLAVTGDPLRSRLLVASRFDDAVVVFDRDPLTGRLDFAEVRRDGEPDPLGPLDGLGGARSLALSPWSADEGRNVYVAGFTAPGVAVFAQDMSPPTLPVFTHPAPSGHQTGVWSNQRVIEGEWASDDGLGLGLAGYVVRFDQDAATELGSSLDLQTGTSPQRATSGMLVDADDHYLHVRACDRAGNCSATAHQGPFLIDATAPNVTAPLTATSSLPGVVTMAWGAATDASSGVFELRARLDTTAADACSTTDTATVVLAADATSWDRAVADGHWRPSLCVIDLAGNRRLLTAAPVTVDTTGPRVSAVTTVRRPLVGDLRDGDQLPWGPTQLLIDFDEEQLPTATDPDSYRLLTAGENGTLESATCDAVAGDDRPVTLLPPEFDPTMRRAKLTVSASRPLTRGRHRLLICAAHLVDDFGNSLDGNGDGMAGDDFLLEFDVLRTNLLVNPHFDESLTAWTPSPGSNFLFDPEDADLADSSGSAFLDDDFGQGQLRELQQCLPLGSETHLNLEATGRWTWPVDVGPFTALDIGFFDAPSCTGNVVDDSLGPAFGNDTDPSWLVLPSRLVAVPPLARSALFRLSVFGDAAGQARLDNVFVGDPLVIFLDGFETGDAGQWSAQVPAVDP